MIYRLTIILPCITLLFINSLNSYASDSWDDFVPPPDNNFDWIQLVSGEWLKGEIKAVYSDEIIFESDKLGDLKLDFDDVKHLRSAGNKRIKIETDQHDTKVLAGKLMMKDNTVHLDEGGKEFEIRRENVISISDDADTELDYWLGSISFGANVRSGNTKTSDVVTTANLTRIDALTRLAINYRGNYSRSRTGGLSGPTEETVDNQRLKGYFDWLYTSRYYWRILSLEYFRDPFSNIANQYSFGTGIGYDLIRSSRTDWRIDAGIGYQQTIFEQPPAEIDDTTGSFFGALGTAIDHELNNRTDYLFDYSARFLSEENGGYTHHMVTTLSFELFKAFDLDVSLIWDRIEQPTPFETTTEDGSFELVFPERDDIQFVAGIAYDF